MKILVTGANHPIARNIISFLNASHVIRAVDAQLDAILPDGVEGYPYDLRTLSGLASLVEGVDLILHCAPLSLTLDDDLSNLEHAVRGTYHLIKVARTTGVKRFVVGSTLDLFAALPANMQVNPSWRPRPQPKISDLCAWLAESIVREDAREPGMTMACLRFGSWVYDLNHGALAEVLNNANSNWSVTHLGDRPSHVSTSSTTLLSTMPVPKLDNRPIRNVVLFGAGGPMGSIVAQELKDKVRLRLTDVRPLDQLAATATPQSVGAPLPQVLPAPHEWRVVDVGNPQQVMDACEGMDAIINCTVIRKEVIGAFRVNTVGAYNIMRAAVAHGIRRIVQTGPFQMGRGGATGYDWDTRIVDDVPERPGGFWDLYFHSKLAGQEITRIFAEHYGLDVPNLLFCGFVDPERTPASEIHPFTISWRDSARAIAAALDAQMPSPYETMHINADLPHGVFPNHKAKRILGWQPQDDLRKFWSSD